MKKTCVLVFAISLGFFATTDEAMARSNVLSGGLSLSYDYQNRDSESSTLTDSGDDFSKVAMTPSLQFVSSSQRDSFEVSVAPSLKYDIDESETDLDYNSIFTGYDRALSPVWQLSISNNFLLSDYESSDERVDEQDTSVAPELSSDLGRRRFWRNTLAVSTAYSYRQDSSNSASFDWVVLRNDDSGDDIEGYDRYTGTLSNSHRYNADWRSSIGMTVVRGEYEESDTGDLSADLWEYRPNLSIENNMIDLNPLTLSYNYTGTRYDESEQIDSDIHQLRFSWRRDFSPHFYTNIGVGPTYEESEGRDGSWGTNGIIEANYQVRRGSYRFAVEKSYDVENFSGTEERGVVDAWSAAFSFNRDLTQYIGLSGNLRYRNQDRTEIVAGSGNTVTTEETNEEQYRAGVGMSYQFWRYYSAGIDYTFISNDGDQSGDDYDDHRIFLSLSWNRELMRW